MKIRLGKEYRCYELYGTIEINPEDYPELKDKTDDEILEYLEENMYEFEIKNGSESNLIDEFEFNNEMLKQDYFDENYTLYKID